MEISEPWKELPQEVNIRNTPDEHDEAHYNFDLECPLGFLSLHFFIDAGMSCHLYELDLTVDQKTEAKLFTM